MFDGSLFVAICAGDCRQVCTLGLQAGMHAGTAGRYARRGGGGGLRSESVKSNCEKLPEKLRCRSQTSRSLKEQHLFAGDTQRTHTHAREGGGMVQGLGGWPC